MLLFAHTGIPLGVACLSQVSLARAPSGKPKLSWGKASNPGSSSTVKASRARQITGCLDYRLLLVGSMLPDLIDKPLGTWLLHDALSNGRIFGHTLLFTVLLAAIGFYLYTTSRNPGMLCLSFGSMAHLLLDEMWLNPRTLLWPFYGWGFEKVDVSHWLQRMLTSLGSEPSVYVPEIIGALLLGAFFFELVRQGKLYNFLRTGQVG